MDADKPTADAETVAAFAYLSHMVAQASASFRGNASVLVRSPSQVSAEAIGTSEGLRGILITIDSLLNSLKRHAKEQGAYDEEE